jgi:hypothetical protein
LLLQESKNHRQHNHSSSIEQEIGAPPGQIDRLDAKSQGGLSLPMVVGENTRDMQRFCYTITQHNRLVD